MKISIHPLFFGVIIFCAFFGGLPVTLIFVMTALLHECGHIFCAEKMGFKCEKIKIMPYGAAAVCDIEGISPSDEIKLSLAGPLVNLLLCVGVAGLWWVFPVTYAYTDLIFYASAGMLVLNLLPAYPLDGGRIAKCVISGFLKKNRALNIALRVVNVLVVISLIFIYFFALKNLSLLTVAVFLFCSALSKSPPALKINFATKKKRKGREIRYVILDGNATFKDALRFVDSSRYLILQLYNEKFLDEITEDELYEKLLTRSIYDKILD